MQRRRLRRWVVVPIILISVLESCSDDGDPAVSCTISADDQSASVTLASSVDSSSSGQVGDYQVTFSVLPQRRLHATVTKLSSGEIVMSTESSGLDVTGATGSLSYACRV